MLLDVRKTWAKIKDGFAKVTSVISSMLKVVSPQWVRADAAWKAWTWTKRGIALGLLTGGAIIAHQFSVSIANLGHSMQIARSDMSSMAKASDISSLQRQIDEIKSQLSKIDDTIDNAQASRITTGSIPKKKTKVVKSSASSWFSIP